MTFKEFIFEYVPVSAAMAVIIYLFDVIVGRLMDQHALKQERIRSEAEKHMDEYLKELGR
jgi:hypothetical protein